MDPQEYVAKYTAAFSRAGESATLRPERNAAAPNLPAAVFYPQQAGQRLEAASRLELLRLVRSCLGDGSGDPQTLADLERSCRDKLEQQSRLRAELDTLRGENQDLKRQLDLVHGSTSWRMTAPLRWTVTALRRALGRRPR
jgi:hypothetical protein